MAAPASAGDASEASMAILPERGLVFSEIKPLQLQLCKPKLLPIKSYSLERLERMEKKMAQDAKEKREQDRAQRQTAVGWTSPDLLAAAPVPRPAVPRPAPVPAGRGEGAVSAGPTAAVPADAAAVREGTPPSSRLAAASPETLSSPPANTDEDAGADAPMSAPERSSRLSSDTAVSASSSSSADRSPP